MTRIGERSEPLQDLMAEAAHAALPDAGLERPGAIVVATMNPEEFLGDGNFASQRRHPSGVCRDPGHPRRDRDLVRRGRLYIGFARWRRACAAPSSWWAARR